MSRPRFARLVGAEPSDIEQWVSGEKPLPTSVANFITLLSGLDLPAEAVFEMLSGRAASDGSAQLKAAQRAHRQAASAAQAVVLDLEAKLWGGHSKYASSELENLVSSELVPPEGRLLAAYELARWQIHTGDYASALKNLRRRSDLNPARTPRKEALLLELAVLMELGELNEAAALIDAQKKAAAADGDIQIAKNNLAAKQFSSNPAQRLRILNELFEAAGLSPVHLARGLDLNIFNIRSYAPESTSAFAGEAVSVLMAAFNAEEHIEMSAASILAQSHHNLELIIVDDCSDDGTWDKLKAIAASDARVRVFRNETNVGAYISRNIAFSHSLGRVVTVHDSDDWSHPQIIERQLDALLADDDVRGTMTAMARATDDLVFKVRPHRRRSEYVHRSFPSLMMRREDVELLGQWDNVRANADAEFVRRTKVHFGPSAVVDVLPTVPMSFFMIRADSLTEREDTSLLSLTFGVRREYNAQSDYYMASRPSSDRGVLEARTSKKYPFPVPETLLPHSMKTERRYDLLVISDLAREPNEIAEALAYINVAVQAGFRVALFHWPDPQRPAVADVNPEFRRLNMTPSVDIITFEEEIEVSYIFVCDPQVLLFPLDRYPRVQAAGGGLLMSQAPSDLSAKSAGRLVELRETFRDLYGLTPDWLVHQGQLRDQLVALGEDDRIARDNWYPPVPFFEDVDAVRVVRPSAPKLGRITEPHRTSWPEDEEELFAAYLADTVLDVQFWGGDAPTASRRSNPPRNWSSVPFAVSTNAFVAGIDFYLHYPSLAAGAKVDPNAIAAMAAGVPLVTSPTLEAIYGDSAIYAYPADVYEAVQSAWFNAARYEQLSRSSRSFAVSHSGEDTVRRRMMRLVAAALKAER